jgi:hypothetical protein
MPATLEAPPGQERLVEYTTSRGATLRVNREAGVISGVKILGLQSRNGREYERAAAQNARGLYEGIAVNVDHVEGKGQRSYSSRIGKLAAVEIREEGLYGDLLVNPKHALAEQLFWDAEHAPDKVGLSHDATGKTKRRGGKTVVESIDVVRSVDLVAEPATTAGLFESVSTTSHHEEKSTMEGIDLKEATADQLKKERPDLFKLIQRELAEATDVKAKDAEIADLKKKLQEAEEKEAAAAHREKVAGELKEAKLDEPGDVFLGVLLAEQDEAKRKALIDDRKQLVEAAGGTKGETTTGKPKSDFSGGGKDESGGAFDFDHFSEAIKEPALA